MSVPEDYNTKSIQGFRRGLLFVLVIFLMVVVLPGVSAAQAPTADVLQTEVSNAFRSGDAPALFLSAARQLDISVNGEGGLYSRAQGTHVLKRFFVDNPPDGFEVSEANDSPGRRLILGEYKVRKKEFGYRIYAYLRDRDGSWELKELRIESADPNVEG